MNIFQCNTGIIDFFGKVMESNVIDVAQFLKEVEKSINCVRDAMFYKKVTALMKELEIKEADKRKIGKILAESDYGEEYGFVLLKYIDDYECVEKGKYLAYLLDSLSKDFISSQECFTYAKLLKDVSLISLKFIKNNVSPKIFDKSLELNELSRYDLVYRANEGGYAFEMMSYYLDKYALSYMDEKYKYNGEKDYIPDRSQFPKKASSLLISQGVNY